MSGRHCATRCHNCQLMVPNIAIHSCSGGICGVPLICRALRLARPSALEVLVMLGFLICMREDKLGFPRTGKCLSQDDATGRSDQPSCHEA